MISRLLLVALGAPTEPPDPSVDPAAVDMAKPPAPAAHRSLTASASAVAGCRATRARLAWKTRR